MQYWRTFTFLLLINIIKANINYLGRHSYNLQKDQLNNFTIQIQKAIRISIVQQLGKSLINIQINQEFNIQTSDIIYEEIISSEMIGKICQISLQGQSNISKGLIIIQFYEKYQFINPQFQNIFHLTKNSQRILEIHPRKKLKLMIQRLDGIPQFILNRCKTYEKKECLDEMHRFTPSKMKKHIQALTFDQCSNCLVLIKLTTKSDSLKIRISFTNKKIIIPQYPNMILLKREQTLEIETYPEFNKKGRILIYSGSIQIYSDNTFFTNFTNGYFYGLNKQKGNQTSDSIVFTIKGLKELSYLIIQYPINEENITLIDGFTSTVFIQTGKTYLIKYQNHNRGKSNVVLSSSTEVLSRLSLKFSGQTPGQHYLIRPKYLFNETIASQNFQLDQSFDKIQISMHLISGVSGFLNISAQVNELITIPLDYKYSSILYYQEYDEYIFEGITGNVQINIQKCVDCSLKYAISEEYIQSSAVKQMSNFSLSQTFKIHKNELYIRIQTGNYALYSIYVTKTLEKHVKTPRIQQNQIKFYLNDNPEDSLILQFHPPTCKEKVCQNVVYYLMESSNEKQISSILYCHSQLFDFDQNIKDIIIETIQPERIGQLMSYTRLIKHRDFIGIAAYVDNKVLPYRVINIEDVKIYKEIKWPLFFMAIFVILALFCFFVIFMALRKRDGTYSKGYKRIPQDYSEESYQ